MRKIIISALLLTLIFLKAEAHIDVVYPSKTDITVNAPSVFFIGNTSDGADFRINSEKIKLWNNNFFVHVIPLKYGINEIKMVSVKNGLKEQSVYTVRRNKPAGQSAGSIPKYQPKNKDSILYTKTVNDRAVVREKPSGSAARVSELSKDVVLYLLGKQGDYYKIDAKGAAQLWIHKSNIDTPVNLPAETPALLKNIKTYDDKNYYYTKFELNYPVMYKLQQQLNDVSLTLYGVQTFDSSGIIPNFTYRYSHTGILAGYDAYYENNTLVFRAAKTPKIKNKNKPLKNIKIFIDAGHGGEENGSIGPSRICEKDVNLAVSRYLAEYLEEEGADVIMSRKDDKTVKLYDRVKKAKEHDAFISVSIHNNALPDGKDPYKNHGTEVHYYNGNAVQLAEIIQKDMVRNLNFKDNGVHKSSFALTRSSSPVSVLVECAYMINPEEYMRLINPDVQKQIARSIKDSLKKYIIAVQRQQM